MLVSIIITLFNRKELVVRTIESIKDLSKRDDVEVLIIDDGSDDNPLELISKYIDGARIKYCYKENGGAAEAKNFGAQLAGGKYIIFLDSDDYLINTEKLIDYIKNTEKNNYTFFYSESVIIKKSDIQIEEFLIDKELIESDIYKYILSYPLNYPGKPTYVFLREAFMRINGFTLDFHWGDAMLFWRKFLKGASYYNINFPTYVYDQSDLQSVSRNKDGNYYEKVYSTLSRTYDEIEVDLRNHQFNMNWVIILCLLSLRRLSIKDCFFYFSKMLANPLLAIKAIRFVVIKRIGRG